MRAGSNQTSRLPVTGLACTLRIPPEPDNRSARRVARAGRPRMASTRRRARPRTAVETGTTTVVLTVVPAAGRGGPPDGGRAGRGGRGRLGADAAPGQVAIDVGAIRAAHVRRGVEDQVREETHQ